MNRVHRIVIFLFIIISCGKDDVFEPNTMTTKEEFITAVDISRYPEISRSTLSFYDLQGNKSNLLLILKDNGINTIRLRLWVSPIDGHSGFEEVKAFSQILKSHGFKVWLTLHYSDTWADPGHQEIPSQWVEYSFNSLKDRVYEYTQTIVTEIKPHYIQIGNEINSGILHPYGEIASKSQNFINLIQAGCLAVRANSKDCKIILHYAGIANADWFFSQVNMIDYDIIGLSYYPIWHGKSLDALKKTMHNLSNSQDKKIVIAETAYPFTLKWNDWTDNIVGLDEQLILPEYPATAEGQRKFIKHIKTLTKEIANGIGFCYWGAELIAWKGSQSTDASPWENQALFDFDNNALPVLKEFKSK